MIDNTQKIVSYIADASQLLSTIKTIEQANARLAKMMGNEFSSATKVISSDIGKIKTVEIFDKQGMKSQVQLIEEMSTVVQTADGSFVKFDESMKNVDSATKQISGSITDVTGKFNKLGTTQKQLSGQASQLGTNLSNVNDINQKFGKELKNVGNVSNIVRQEMSSFSGNTKKMGVIVEGINGKFYKLSESTKIGVDGIQKVSRSVKEVSKDMAIGTKATSSLGDNIARLASRAILTIPLWLALRGAIMGTLRMISGGFKDIEDFDRALQKLRKNLQGTPEEITKNFNNAKNSIVQFSLESGKSVEEITNAIQQFATAGFDFATSMSAGQDAVRLSVLLFGDAKETAIGFSRGLRALISNVDDAVKSQQELSEAMALSSQLYETNIFEIGELSNGLQKFGGTAKSMNFTINETITLLSALSTRGLSADRAGTLLRTSVQKLEGNLSKVARVLGIEVNPQVDRTFDVFVKVTNAISKLKNESGKISPAVTDAIGELFGGVRGGEPIRDLIADMAKVNEAFQKFAGARPDVIKFREDFDKTSETIYRQIEIIKNLKKEIGRAFIEGITGADDYLEALLSISNAMKGILSNTKSFGSGLRIAFLTATFQVENLIKEFKNLDKIKLSKARQELEKLFNLSDITDTGKLKDISKELEEGYKGLFGFTKEAKKEMQTAIKERIDELEKVAETQKSIADESKKAQSENNTVELEANRQKKAELVLKSELDRLKALGSSNVQLIKAEMYYTKILGLSREEEDILQKKLDLEKAVAEEKRLQGKLGSDSIKLFRIAQEQGTDIAKKIGEVLSGDVDFDLFVRKGGQAVETFKKEFGDIFEQKQAEAFFKGDVVPDLKGLRGGFGIDIQEEQIRKASNGLLTIKTKVLSMAERELLLTKNRLKIEEQILNKKAEIKPYIEKQARTIKPQDVSMQALTSEYDNLMFNNTDRQKFIKSPANSPVNKLNAVDISIAMGAVNVETNMDKLDEAIGKSFDKAKKEAIKEVKDKLLGKQGLEF